MNHKSDFCKLILGEEYYNVKSTVVIFKLFKYKYYMFNKCIFNTKYLIIQGNSVL